MDQNDKTMQPTFNLAPLGIAHVGMDGKWLSANRKFCEIVGYKKHELLRLTFQDITHPDDLPKDFKQINKLLSGKVQTAAMEKRYIRKDRSVSWVNATGSLVRDKNGNPKYGICIAEDINERKQTEESIKLMLDVADTLSGSLNPHTTLSKLTNILVPSISDWCIIDLVEKGKVKRIKVTCGDLGCFELADKLLNFPPSSEMLHGINPIFKRKLTPKYINGFCRNKNYLKLLGEMDPVSMIYMPITISEKIAGSITLYSNTPGKYLSNHEMKILKLISSRISLMLENVSLYNQARESIKQRDEFLSIASHELKTPLTTISLQMQLALSKVRENLKPDDMEKLFNNTLAETQRITKLVNDLLNISLITQGKLKIDKKPVDLSILVGKILKEFNHQFKSNNCILECKIKQNVIVLCDPARMEQVVVNLISNALKYGKEKPIKVCVKRENGKAVITVKDHGIGIAPRDQKRIFERFTRGKSASEGGFKGLGIGLYISNLIVQAHGGEISIKSSAGKGSQFIVSLPIR